MTSSAYERRAFMGGAAATTITNGITSGDVAITIASSAGWDTSGGLPFYAVIDRGGTTEEKIRITGVSGTSLSLDDTGDRGCDGTTAQAHSAGASIEVCGTGIDFDEANQLAVQVLDRYDAKGDIVVATAAHETTTLTVGGTDDHFLIVDSGTASGLAYSAIPTGAISAAGMFAAGVINPAALATDSVTTVKILDSNVTTAKIANTNVTSAKLADDSIDDARLFAAGVAPTIVSASTPSSPTAGMQWWDTTTARLKLYDGTNWKLIGGRQLFCGIQLQTTPTALTTTESIPVAFDDSGFLDLDGMHAADATHIVIPSIDICTASFWLRVTVRATMATEASGSQGVGFHVHATDAFTSGTPSNLGEVREVGTVNSPRLSHSETVAVAAGYKVTPIFYANATTPSLTGATAQFEFMGYVA